jgi:hypothetical protein
VGKKKRYGARFYGRQSMKVLLHKAADKYLNRLQPAPTGTASMPLLSTLKKNRRKAT